MLNSDINTNEIILLSLNLSEITAAFTTANARVRLYNMLDWLDDDQIIYCDTDSCIFLYDPDDPNQKDPKLHAKEAANLGI